MKTLNSETVTRSAISRLSKSQNPRLKEIVRSLTRHLHDFAREVKLTPDEWLAGIEFLTAVGHITDEKRQEFILLSDTLGLSAVVDLIANQNGNAESTESSLLGPFFREGAPLLPLDADISNGALGEKMFFQGTIRDSRGNAVANAIIDTWQASADGLYDLQQSNSNEMNLRARFRADENGRFSLRSVKPSSYPVPNDGPVGKMLNALGRHPYRPAHLHFIIAAPGYKTLTTSLYMAGDPYLDSDAVFGAKKSLVVRYRPSHKNGTSHDTIEFEFVLASERLSRRR